MRKLLHQLNLRNQLFILFHNFLWSGVVQDLVDLAVNTLDAGTDIAFNKAETFNFAALL